MSGRCAGWIGVLAIIGMSAAIGRPADAQTAETGRAAVAARLAQAPGYSGIFAVTRSGQTEVGATSGHQPDQVWRWASVTKMITAILVLQQVDAGRLALDAPLATYWPDFPVNADRVTIRQLLTHTSGLANPDATPDANGDGLPDFYQKAGDWRSVCSGPALAAPGAAFAYDNCDYLILGEVLERVTGDDFNALVRKRLVEPLGLGTVAVPSGPRSEARVEGAPEPAIDPTSFGSAGGLYGSAADLLKIDQALMAGTLMSDGARAEMLKGDPQAGFAALSVWSWSPNLGACLGQTRLVERYGEIGGVQVRNFLLPDKDLALTVYSDDGATRFGDVWQGEGLSVDLIRAAACGAGASPAA